MKRNRLKQIMIICSLIIFAIEVFDTKSVVYAAEYTEKKSGYYSYIDYEGGAWITGYDNGLEYWEQEDNITWKIPDTLNGLKVVGIGDIYDRDQGGYLNYYVSIEYNVSKIILPDSISEIGEDAFSKFYSLKSINIPNQVTGIGCKAFFKCKELQNIEFPDSLDYIGDYAFYGCSSLTSITIPASVEEIYDNAFADCRSVVSYKVSSGNSNYFSYKDMLCQNSFHYKYEEYEEEYDEDDADEEVPEIKVIQYPGAKKGAFFIEKNMYLDWFALLNETGITEFTVDSENMYYCSKNGILYDKENTQLIAAPGAMTGELIIPDGIQLIQTNAFSNGSLSKITIPESVDLVGDNAFYHCNQLKSINVGKCFKFIDLSTCQNLSEIIISSDDTDYTVIDNIVYDKKIETMVFCPRGYKGKLVFPNTVTSYEYDCFESADDYEDFVYYRCDLITEWYLGEKFTSHIDH